MSEALHGFDLGPLEVDVLRLVWEIGDAQVDDVHRALHKQRVIAYTTVMTVMGRMVRRGVLERRREGRAYVYRAAVQREELAGRTVREMVQRFWGGQVFPAVKFLLAREKFSARDLAELRALLELTTPEEQD